MIAYTALSAARVVSLPPASAYPTGTRLLIVDETGNCSTTKTLTISPNGSDVIDGATSAIVNVAYGFIGVESNQSGEWTTVDQGFMPALANIAAAAHGANLQIGMLETLVTLSGGSTNASVQIPANCIVLAVGARVVTAITGATSYGWRVRQPVAVRLWFEHFGWLDQLRPYRPDRVLFSDDADHHRDRRQLQRRPGQTIDRLHAGQSLGGVTLILPQLRFLS